MNQNITPAPDKQLLKRVRGFASRRGTSISAMSAAELRRMAEAEEAYEHAKNRALEHLRSPFWPGGGAIIGREALHDRQIFR